MPMSFPSAVNPPGGASYMAPLLNFFSDLGNWGSSFEQGTLNKQQQGLNDQSSQLNSQTIQQRQQQLDLGKAFPNGLPIDPNTGQVDYARAAQVMAKFGDVGNAVTLLGQQPPPMSPMFGGGGQPGASQGQPQQPAPTSSSPDATAAKIIQVEGSGKNPRSSADGVGQFTESTWIESIKKYFPNLAQGRSDDQLLAMRKIPQLAARVTEAFTAGNEAGLSKAGLPVTPATTYLAHFAGLGGAIKVLQADPNTPVAQVLGNAAVKANPFLQGMTARDLELWAARKMQGPAMVAQNAQAPQGGATQVASAAPGDLPPSANAVSPAPKAAPAQQPQQRAPIGAGSAQQPPGAQPPPSQPPQGAPAPVATQPQAPQGPITPQEPLPPGYNDPQKAIVALRAEADKYDRIPNGQREAKRLDAWADRIAASIAPVDVGQYTTKVDPRTGKVLYQGPGAALISGAAGRSETIESDAEVYRQTGKLPTNIGRGVQGNAESHAIRTLAREQEIAEGGDPAEWPTRWQSFGAQATGKRVLEQRAAGLRLAENEAESLIPRVREISSKIKRTDYPTINSLMLAAQKGTGGTDVIKLGIAVESLVPVYARVLKPTGQLAQGDMARAHDILDKAWSDGQIGAALDQMQVELKSARSALDKTMSESANRGGRTTDRSAPADGASTPGGVTPGGLQWSVVK